MAMTNEAGQLRRALEEANRRADEQSRLTDEQRRLREQAEQDAKNAQAVLLRKGEEHSRMTLDQPLDDYLRGIHRLNFHMPRLLPRPGTTVRALSEGRRSRSTTRGRTDIVNKYYPLHLRVWGDFPALCQERFSRIRDTLGTQGLFPSAAEVAFNEKSLVEQTPEGFFESESSLTARKSSFFLHETLERPAQRVLNAYLGTNGHEQKLYFDCYSAGWLARSDSSGTSISPANRRSSSSSSNSNSSQSSSGAETSTDHSHKKIQPDCLVLCFESLSSPVAKPASAGGPRGAENPVRSVYRVTLGEHKAIPRLRAVSVSRYLESPVAPDFLVQLARRALSDQTVPGLTRDAAAGEAEGTSTTKIRESMFFIYALTQTFHYMVISGLEFGYVATGETLSFLRVPRDDPTTLLYHTEVFPQYCRPGGGNADAVPADGAVTVDQLATAKLCGLALLAFESAAASPRHRSIHISQLALFPNLPPSLTDDPTTSSPTEPQSRDSSQGRRRRHDERDDDNDDDNDDNNDDGDDGGGGNGRRVGGPRLTATHRPRNPSFLNQQPSTPGHQPPSHAGANETHRARRPAYDPQPGRARSPLLPSLPGPFDPASFKPIRPYCTQTCLRSLVRGEGVDYDCPNALLHLEAVRRTGGLDRAGHAIGPDELVELVRLQLLDNAERDCECFLDRGLAGAIGCLFKVTVTGYGYTLVAKGVHAFNAARIRHEARVYRQLEPQQGVLIPVCLGVAKLLLPYPMLDCTLITHMLLLSYAGIPLYSSALRRRLDACRVDLDAEVSRTLKELRAVGLEDHDNKSNGNLTWCPSSRRVMKIDFDQALVREDLTKRARKRAAGGLPGPDERLGCWEAPLRRNGSLTRYPSMRRVMDKRRRQDGPRHSTVASLLLA